MNYIDLCCGIGGFHQAIERVCEERHEDANCLFAVDNDKYAAKLYEENYGIDAFYDLKSEETHKKIKDKLSGEILDFLFAGFPCQPFSKAGSQMGFEDKTKGTIFYEILEIVKSHNPRMILLETVRNVYKHKDGNTWKTIKDSLENAGYIVDHVILSPNQVPDKKIPALRERFFILCYNKNYINDLDSFLINYEFLFRKKHDRIETSIYDNGLISKGLRKDYFNFNGESDLEEETIKIIDMWNNLYHLLRQNNRKLISPLWPQYFSSTIEEIENDSKLPDWKKGIIKRNIRFYEDNKLLYDSWYEEHKLLFDSLIRSNQKFEWNAGEDIDDVWKGIIQFRPSGVRVKRPDFIPTLVAITQTPILGCEKRYLQPEEMARLYGFKSLNFNNQPLKETYKQLGNTVSVDVIEYLIKYMLSADLK